MRLIVLFILLVSNVYAQLNITSYNVGVQAKKDYVNNVFYEYVSKQITFNITFTDGKDNWEYHYGFTTAMDIEWDHAVLYKHGTQMNLNSTRDLPYTNLIDASFEDGTVQLAGVLSSTTESLPYTLSIGYPGLTLVLQYRWHWNNVLLLVALIVVLYQAIPWRRIYRAGNTTMHLGEHTPLAV